MVIQARIFLALMATVACTDSSLLRPRVTVSPTASEPMTSTHVLPLSRGKSHSFTTKDLIATTEEPHQPMTETWPSTTTNAVTSTQNVYPNTGTSPSTTTDATASTEEPHPPVQSSFFTIDAFTRSSILTLPGNESVSKLLFWPPSDGIQITLNMTLSASNYTFTIKTILPQHWHTIDILHPVKGPEPVKLYIHTESRYFDLEHSRVVQIQVGSDQPTHWCFCPDAYLCSMLSPLEYDSDSSRQRTDLIVALFVVVFLLIATLLALGGVTFYRKSELFHIYAKPIDCLPHAPPPLPTSNMQSGIRVDRSKEMKKAESENVRASTNQTDDSEYSRVGGEVVDNVPPPLPPARISTYERVVTQKQKHESINGLYGLV